MQTFAANPAVAGDAAQREQSGVAAVAAGARGAGVLDRVAADPAVAAVASEDAAIAAVAAALPGQSHRDTGVAAVSAVAE